MRPRRFFLILVIGLLSGLPAVAALNRVVDPFWYFRDIELDGLNAVRTKFVRFERRVKPAVVARERPQAIVLGSSFAEVGFDPLDPGLTEAGRLSGYNFAIAGAEWARVQCYVEHALARARPKRILLGISLVAMPRVDCTKHLADMDSPDLASFLISTDALQASLQTIWEQRKAVGSHTREGLYRYKKDARGVDARFVKIFRDFEKVCPLDDLAVRHLQTLAPALPASAAAVDLSGLSQILEMAKRQTVDVFLLIYPVHAYVEELAYLCGTHADRWAMVRALAQVVDRAARGAGVRIELWDFPGYNALTGERVTSGLMRHWQDPRHFNSELGDILLASIFSADGARGTRFGYRVIPGAVTGEFERVTRERRDYVAAQTWFLPELARLLARAGVMRAPMDGG